MGASAPPWLSPSPAVWLAPGGSSPHPHTAHSWQVSPGWGRSCSGFLEFLEETLHDEGHQHKQEIGFYVLHCHDWQCLQLVQHGRQGALCVEGSQEATNLGLNRVEDQSDFRRRGACRVLKHESGWQEMTAALQIFHLVNLLNTPKATFSLPESVFWRTQLWLRRAGWLHSCGDCYVWT